jgi:hypothetical protein
VLLTDDGGTTWGDTVAVFEGADIGGSTSPYDTTFDISAFAAGKSSVQVGFNYAKRATSAYGAAWRMDDVVLNADGVPLVTENFDSAWGTYGDNPPAGWTILDFSIADPWNNNDWYGYYYSTGYDQVLLTFKQFYNDDTGDADTAWVLGTTDNWSTTQPVAMYTADQGTSSSPDFPSYDITSWANNQADVKIAFKYVANNNWYWYLDNVQVEGITLLADDVMTEAINSPNMGITGYNHDVSMQVYNLGTNSATFQDSVEIEKINKATYFYENFSNPQGWTGASPPVNVAGTWAVIDSGDEASPVWNNNDWYGYYYSTWSDTIARVFYSPIELQNEWLITPSLDFTGLTDLHLTFKQFYNDIGATSSDTGWVLGTTDDWATTQTIAMYNADQGTSSNPDFPDYDISAWADGQSNVKIAFKYVGDNDWYWYLDNVEIYAVLAPTVDYISGETVTALASLESREVVYTSTWNDPDAADYTLTTWTNLVGDEDPSNDTMSVGLTVYEHYESGGPDAGYYSWDSDKDGGTGDPYSWIDITGIGTPVTWDGGSLDNQYTYGIPLGFSFTFYGNPYDRIYLSMNGYASFDTITSTSSTNYHLPSTSGQDNILALLWDDLSDESGGTVYTYTNSVDTFIVSYVNWDFDIDLDQRIDAQLILTASDNGIKYQYQEVGPVITLSHSIGIEDDPGNIGLEFVYNGTPMGNIAMSGLAITFSYNPPAIDISVNNFTDTPATGLVGVGVDPDVEFSNLGSDPADNVPVRLTISPGTYDDPQTITSLPAGAFDTVSFSTFTPSTAGVYIMTAENELADGDDANDTLSFQYTAYDAIEDFESDDGGLLADGEYPQ